MHSIVVKKYFAFKTFAAASPPMADTPNALKRAEPTIVPMPKSDFVTNVPMTLANSSGQEVAEAIKVAAATS